MAIEFNCSECGKLLRVPDGSGGKQAKCPHCSVVMKVPGESGGGSAAGAAASGGSSSSSPWKEPPEPKTPESGFGLDASDDPLGLGNAGQAAAPQPANNPFAGAPQQPMPQQPMPQKQAFNTPNPGMGAAPGGFQPVSHGAPFSAFNGAPHRGGMVLTFGILSIVFSSLGLLTCCCGCLGIFSIIGISMGLPAWLMGNGDLKQMGAGAMDPSGQGQTKGGMITGMIGTILGALTLVLAIVLFLLQVFANVAVGPMQQGGPGGPGGGF